ncbi:MAG TPA: putative PEP-binding protein [Candidatus Dormibacteraeota bacterium]|nr:putative PEP-binding protein [Candidatus Dormibacteraeota bacterium]
MSPARATVLRGIAASRGEAAGPVFVVREGPAEGGRAAADFDSAAQAVAMRLDAIADQATSRPEGAAILRAQAAMARDPVLAASVRERQGRGENLAAAIKSATDAYADRLLELDDAYLRQRAADVREIGRLLIAEAEGGIGSRLGGLRSPAVVVARDLSPADTLSVAGDLLLALVTEEGGLTSHTAIVARELGIPAVVGLQGAVAAAAGHAGVRVDGDAGEVTFMDSAEPRQARSMTRLIDAASAPVPVLANAGSVEAATSAAARGAAGIGLFRTEFMFMAQHGPMSEDDQAATYARVCDALPGRVVVVRTLDAGADKPLPFLPPATEANPQLGRRGVRLWLGNEELCRPQVRALLRCAATHPRMQVMLPMVGARPEMVAARALFAAEAASLGVGVPDIGMMVEVPAVAAALEAFQGVTDFVSLGTNDLTQYAVAADRGMDWPDDLGVFNPGVLRLIATVIESARRMAIGAGACGEMAGRPEGGIFLVGVGATSLSMTADSIPAVVEATSRLGGERCATAAREALQADSARGALAVLRSALAEA